MNIKDLLRPNLVELNVSVTDWEDAIRAVGRLLVADKAVEPRFVDAMIRVAKEFGPYIVLAPGFAMPHARPEDGCIRSSMALITLAKPVEFGNPQNDPVNVVVALAAVDNQGHIEGLSDLAEVMSEDGIVEKIAASGSVGEVLAIMYREQA
ncbi:MAG TPA: PTS sugar transporter subunit IIA [Anaerolineaceae bacterium]|nr:PTS sugar transporter subunit IIA [Anaerolineaceae bacterium]HOR83092.1 PTS sugar transporter subunit IIA [Anaerolineaceae bacterium]HPL43017.1 PTS sugar transporter subunit IIA [Anaerolineaceae bacterium]HQC20478.1 PTS sugar transporter subunit IIA [Anaerolineaceae bacterium]